ncbi:metallophosphoesterase family protein [Paenibacillus oryzisoli]|uniref:metallophosphoesterase family protein n=1 Tax=Paenibacillus oryzisoli TaxID=1850517 RepID=UPI003D28E86D
MNKKLQFRSDRSFTIVQFTDLHWKTGSELDMKTRELMEAVLLEEKPDLVVLTGDVIQSGRCEGRALEAFADVGKVIEEHGIPWGAVYGNHDAEWQVTREELMRVQQSLPLCLTERGPEYLPGLGNYVLTVAGSDGTECAAALYMIDSLGDMVDGLMPYKGYDWIRPEQVQWYRERSKELEKACGRIVPSLAFFHIPLPEYEAVWNHFPCYGTKNEKICCPSVNSGLFAAMLERGDIIGTFVGHDHENDFWGDLYGIRLVYGKVTGYNTFNSRPYNGEHRGARIIKLTEGSRVFETWIRMDTGERIDQTAVHLP